MEESRPLTDREIHLIEELGIVKRILEHYDLILMAMCTRLGGDVKMEHAELEHTRKTYKLLKDSSIEDYTVGVRLRVRLK